MAYAFIDRDTSWMDFNERVLASANNVRNPLLERVKFLSITSANLDEFFQVRMGELLDNALDENMTIASTDELVDSLLQRTHEFIDKQFHSYTQIVSELAEHNIILSDIESLSHENKAWLSEYFNDHIYPVLTPLAVDPAHPFPWISSLSVNLAFILREPKTGAQRFARVKIPTNLDRMVRIPDTHTFVSLEDIIAHHWESLFSGLDLESHFVFRVTRSSQYKLDEAGNLLEAMSTVLRRHQRFGRAVRLEIQRGIDSTWTDLLRNEITLESTRIFEVDSMIDLSDLDLIARLEIPELKFPRWNPQVPSRLNKVPNLRTDLFQVLRDRDLLIHRPYESYEETVEALVHQAARDENVLAIKQTLYRAADVNSPIVQALCRAAESGKQVVALVELKARFDEQANIERAKKLEESGVHVVYGKVGLKTHAKLLHIVREEGTSIRYYSHVSTGNYNPSTAGIYEDFDFFTSDERIGRDIGDVFNDLTGFSTFENFRELLVAPRSMRARLLELIESQAHETGSIVMKCNNIVDATILTALCDTAEKGAHVSIIVRGSCGISPEIVAALPTLRVRSIIGRFLEHSRIYKFGTGDDATLLIGSADIMKRNLDHRVEVLTPLHAEHTRRYVNEALSELSDDDHEHWLLRSDGWSLEMRDVTVHDSLMAIALDRSDATKTLRDSQRNMPESLMSDEADE
jgi:polyphosphate kinase